MSHDADCPYMTDDCTCGVSDKEYILELEAEVERLRRWKEEAIEVQTRWDAVATALGLDDPEPLDLGKRRSDIALRRIEGMKAEVERLRQLTRMDLHDAREWVESLKRVAAQRDRLAEALVKHREWFDEVLNLAAGDLDWGLTGSALKVLEDALEDLEQPMPGRARALLSRDEAADRIAELEVDQ